MSILQNVICKDVSISKACKLLNFPRSNFYYQPKLREESELANEIYEIWCRRQIYGYRKITKALQTKGYEVNHKRVLRIMQELGIYAIVPGPHTSKPGKEKVKIPYLLKSMNITEPHQVWQTDITYIRLPGGFVYLLAFIDFFSRYVVSWKISNCMDVFLLTDTLNNAITFCKPTIINFDQGSQFTSNSWLKMLESEKIQPSMTGVGRCIDNVRIERFWRSLKVEEIYMNPPDNFPNLRKQVSEYIDFYNNERFHQALDYKTPVQMLKTQPEEEEPKKLFAIKN